MQTKSMMKISVKTFNKNRINIADFSFASGSNIAQHGLVTEPQKSHNLNSINTSHLIVVTDNKSMLTLL